MGIVPRSAFALAIIHMSVLAFCGPGRNRRVYSSSWVDYSASSIDYIVARLHRQADCGFPK
eukprot:9715978-Alexandrium_andersonii.AAC.1